jgi:hypothetical protein
MVRTSGPVKEKRESGTASVPKTGQKENRQSANGSREQYGMKARCRPEPKEKDIAKKYKRNWNGARGGRTL